MRVRLAAGLTNALLPLVAFILLLGCHSCSLPGPTTKPVSPAEIAGCWAQQATHSHRGDSYTVEIELKTDGTYTQTIRVEGDPQSVTCTGRWLLDGGQITLTGILSETWSDTGRWETTTASWWFVDSFGYGYDPPVFLFGGLVHDPDGYLPFLKLR